MFEGCGLATDFPLPPQVEVWGLARSLQNLDLLFTEQLLAFLDCALDRDHAVRPNHFSSSVL